ncbi:MAG: metal ABC transporter permease [Phycisphaerales bacterium]|nr:metal ABC transporter permease [Phycisphaerales bacterium]
MIWQEYDTWVVITGALCAMACALPGAQLVLRRRSMMGDAISHAVLPGVAIAFLITATSDPLVMLAGAILIGILTTVLIDLVQRAGRTEIGASMGIVFTTLFALGLVLIRVFADDVLIDPHVVIYGSIELSYLDQVSLWGWSVPRGAVVNGGSLLINVTLFLIFYKELKLTAFDEPLAAAMGFRPRLVQGVLMAMTAATAVAAFETVGSILVVAMIIVPGATAWLLTDRYGPMLIWTLVIAVLAAGLGHVAALIVPGWFGFEGMSTAGSMAVMSGVLFAVAWICAPRQGRIAAWHRRSRLSQRIAMEDILGLLYRYEERADSDAPGLTIADMRSALTSSPSLIRRAFRRVRHAGQVDVDGDVLKLTDSGRTAARSLIRTHRLWERFLWERLGLRPDHIHGTADRLEHFTSPEMIEALAEHDDGEDPHGRPIPPAQE